MRASFITLTTSSFHVTATQFQFINSKTLKLDEQIHSLTCTLLSEREALDEEKTRPEMEPQFESREEELRRNMVGIAS